MIKMCNTNAVADKMYRISVTADGVQIRTYIYDKDESVLNSAPTYRTDEENPQWLRTDKALMGEMKKRTVVCDKAGIPNAVKLLHIHFSEQLEKKAQELQELADKVGHLKHSIDAGIEVD